MTDKQIVKALECCCAKENCEVVSCEKCPLEKHYECTDIMFHETVDLIKRQKEEIERLKTMNSELRIGLKVIKRTEIKKLWERLEKEIRYCTDVYGNSIQAINVECANRIVKEMESDKNV